MRIPFMLPSLVALLFLSSCEPARTYHVDIYATNDIHGAYFSKPYSDNVLEHSSLSNISEVVREKRNADGDESLILIDVGDNLQGDYASYYYNFIDTLSSRHLLARIFDFMKYDAVVVGNHDIETGHAVYDRFDKELTMPYLAANAISTTTGESYFEPYTVIKRNGLKVAVIGMTNPNIRKWLSPTLWKGMEFGNIASVLPSVLEEVKTKVKPDVTVLAIHAGIGKGNAEEIENSAVYLAQNFPGIDIILASHDHRQFCQKIYNGQDSVLVIEGGSKAQFLSQVSITVEKENGRIVKKTISGEPKNMKDAPLDSLYDAEFLSDYERVKAYTNQEVGYLSKDIVMSDALSGMSDYVSLIHLVQMTATGADISIAAPLNGRGVIEAGQLTLNDLFNIYQYENQLYVIKMSGREIKNYLETSYEGWLSGHGQPFNFDSAAGLIYNVKKSAPKGERVSILSMADGTPFLLDTQYNVALTSYRASGAGDLLPSVGISENEVEIRLVDIYPEIRDLIYNYILSKHTIDPDVLLDNKILGRWDFVK